MPVFASLESGAFLPFCQRLDAELLASYELSTGVSLSPHSRRQAVLPTRHSGLGLRESARLSATSFVCSVLQFRSAGVALLCAQTLLSPSLRDLVEGLQHLRVGLPPSAHQAWLWASDQASLNSCAFHPDFCTLRWWTEQIYKQDKEDLRDQLSGRDRARFACLNQHSLAWLNVPAVLPQKRFHPTPPSSCASIVAHVHSGGLQCHLRSIKARCRDP